MYPKNEIMFPHKSVPALRSLRGPGLRMPQLRPGKLQGIAGVQHVRPAGRRVCEGDRRDAVAGVRAGSGRCGPLSDRWDPLHTGTLCIPAEHEGPDHEEEALLLEEPELEA